MKTQAVLFVLAMTTFSLTTQAAPPAPKLPSNIECASIGQSKYVKKFSINDLDSKETNSTIFDASLFEREVNQQSVAVSFSNECDNMYALLFHTHELVSLRSGHRKSISGLLTYSDSENINANEEAVEEAVVVTCVLK